MAVNIEYYKHYKSKMLKTREEKALERFLEKERIKEQNKQVEENFDKAIKNIRNKIKTK